MRHFIFVAAISAIAGPALAQSAITPDQFVAKAGASDKFEITEAKMMTTSSNTKIKMIAQHMITDHTDSTAKVKAAAQSAGIMPKPPILNAKQMKDVAALKAAKGAARDKLYLAQQLPAHQEALTLMQTYASTGTAPALKSTAAEIAPVVQGHIDMIQKAM
jgi:putative membrane protein